MTVTQPVACASDVEAMLLELTVGMTSFVVVVVVVVVGIVVVDVVGVVVTDVVVVDVVVVACVADVTGTPTDEQCTKFST